MINGYLWVTGSDNLIAGVNQIISGTTTKTVGASILESIGVPAEYSELVYAGFDVATGMTSVIVKSIKTGQMRQVVLTQNGKTTQVVGNALKDFAASKQGSIKIPGTGAGKGTTGTNVIAQEGAGLVGNRVIQPNSTVKLTESTKLPNGEVIPKGSTVTVSDNTMKVTYPDGTSKISNYDKAISSPSALPDLTNAGKGTNSTSSNPIINPATNKIVTEHTIVPSGKAPQTSTPNSIYEVSRADGSRSITYYDANGRTFSREDYGQIHPHGQMGLGSDGRVVPHEHKITYNDKGFVTGRYYRKLNSNGKPTGDWIKNK